jgi:hypothetical protein
MQARSQRPPLKPPAPAASPTCRSPQGRLAKDISKLEDERGQLAERLLALQQQVGAWGSAEPWHQQAR